MGKKYITIIITLILAAAAFSFQGRKMPVHPQAVSPQTIIYKTKSDYSKYVPVTLSGDKSRIASYPDPKDVYYNGSLAYPTRLAKGYWLDNRGIGLNSAFIKITYEEYSKLPEAPSVAKLYEMIIDKEPFTRMYNLGSRYQYKDAVTEIDRIIESGRLKNYKRIK
jgi:hypothetical protein